MRRRPLVLLATVAVAVLAWASPAMAKGPDQATITGPGLDTPIVISGWGEPGGLGDLGGLADGSGLFVAMFESGQALVAEAPTDALGPRYEIAWRVPDGTPTGSIVRQDLYPLAEGGPVTHTEAGQQAMGAPTSGGWYRAPANFGAELEQIGLPSTPYAPVPPAFQPEPPPQPADPPAPRATPWLPIAGASLVVLLVVAGILFRRWRSRAVAGHAAMGQRG